MVTLSSDHSAPADDGIAREPLRCGDTDSPVPGASLPFVAFKETNRTSGAWRLRIQARDETAALLYPNAIRLQARAVGAQGKSSFTWSHTLPSGSRRRQRVNLLVHVKRGEPFAIEVFPAAPNWSSAASQLPVKFCWPAA